jgi:hypothetical protein
LVGGEEAWMSYEIGLAALRRQPTARLAHTEYCSNYAIVRAVTGRDPLTDPGAWQAFHDAWDIDFLWSTNDGPVPWEQRGRVTDMGHAEFLEGGIDRRDHVDCPFATVEEVWAFDAVEEYGLPDGRELVDFYERRHQEARAAHPEQVVPGGYYKTIVSGMIQSFGWERLLEAAADRQRFERVIDGFFRLSLHHYRAQAETSIEAFICHDDMVWSQGPFMHPDVYRDAIFPRYRKLWEPLREAGKLVLFCSDATFTEFLPDLAAAGADGFIFEPMTRLEAAVEAFGDSHVIVSSKVDCRTLTFGSRAQIAAEIDASLALARRCRGFVFAVGNHVPSNVPVDNARFYMDYLRERWRR